MFQNRKPLLHVIKLLFHTVARDASGAAVEYSVATYRGESNSFEIDVRRLS